MRYVKPTPIAGGAPPAHSSTNGVSVSFNKVSLKLAIPPPFSYPTYAGTADCACVFWAPIAVFGLAKKSRRVDPPIYTGSVKISWHISGVEGLKKVPTFLQHTRNLDHPRCPSRHVSCTQTASTSPSKSVTHLALYCLFRMHSKILIVA